MFMEALLPTSKNQKNFTEMIHMSNDLPILSIQFHGF